MRILHVHENLVAAGGIETYLLSLIPQLEAHGHECGYVFADGNAGLVDQSFQVQELVDSTRAGGARATRHGPGHTGGAGQGHGRTRVVGNHAVAGPLGGGRHDHLSLRAS